MFARVFGCCRVVFNDAVRLRAEANRAGIKLSATEIQRRVITLAKTTDERAWLAEVPSVALIQSVNDSRRAWHNYFDSCTGKRRGRAMGQPRMKSKKDHRQAFRVTRGGFKIQPNGRVYLAKLGEVRVRWSRQLPSTPSSVTVIREADGRYYATFVVEVPRAPLPSVDREAGIDLGLTRLATIADDRRCTHRHCQSEALGPQATEIAAVRAGEISSTERISQQGQDAAQDRDRAQQRRAYPAGLSPQAGFGAGSREPSDPRRRPQHRGNGPKSSARAGNQRCGVGAVHPDHHRKSRRVRHVGAYSVALAGVE